LIDAVYLYAHPKKRLGLYHPSEDDLRLAREKSGIALRAREAVRGMRQEEHHHDQRWERPPQHCVCRSGHQAK